MPLLKSASIKPINVPATFNTPDEPISILFTCSTEAPEIWPTFTYVPPEAYLAINASPLPCGLTSVKIDALEAEAGSKSIVLNNCPATYTLFKASVVIAVPFSAPKALPRLNPHWNVPSLANFAVNTSSSPGVPP